MRSTLIGVATGFALAGAASLAIAQQQLPGDKGPAPAAQDKAREGKDQGGPGMQQPRAKDAPKGMDRPKATERPDRDRPKGAERKGDRIQLSDQQRSKVTERLRRTRVERTRIDINVNIGSRIPRSVRLHAPPAAIIAIAPAYRGYRYVVLENETIVIVDPQTYVVVDVISVGPGRPQLALSAEEMSFIFRNVPKERTANVRLRLALGAEVPRGVDLLAFPGRVVERVPEIGGYRYIVAQNDVAIIDPRDHSIVLVISE